MVLEAENARWRQGRRQVSFVSDETESLLNGRERWINSINSTEMVAQICPNYRRSAKIAARIFYVVYFWVCMHMQRFFLN